MQTSVQLRYRFGLFAGACVKYSPFRNESGDMRRPLDPRRRDHIVQGYFVHKPTYKRLAYGSFARESMQQIATPSDEHFDMSCS